MRNVVKTLSVVLIALVLMAGCAKKEEEVKVPATETIKLQENASTGYKWEIKVADESIAKIESNEYTEKTSEDIVGAPGFRTIKVAGLKEGTTTITLKYVGPGKKKPVAKTLVYDVTVNADKDASLVLEV